MNRSLLASLAFCAAASISASAVAGPPGYFGGNEKVTRTVNLGDVNLHSQAGAKVAAFRIRLAADYVCGGDDMVTRFRARFNECRSKAIDRALTGFDAPMVWAALGRQTPTDVAQR